MMRFGTMTKVTSGIGGVLLLAGVTAGCGPTQAEKDLAARMETAASRAEAAGNKAEAAARAASDAAARAQAAADKAEAIFQKHMRK
jgi:outer membrane murein-binding lipoprotein Lpp